MSKFGQIIKWLLIAWGALCGIGAILFFAFLAYHFGPGNRPSDKKVSIREVRHILNWCQLGDDRIEEVLHSHISAGGFTGDHLDAHAILISHVNIEELKSDDFGSGWHRGDQVEGVLDDALDFIGGGWTSREVPWFPSENELRSKEMFVFPWTIEYRGTRPDSVELIFIKPQDKIVYFISLST